MPTGHALDLNAIHAALWERSDRLHRLKVVQSALAQEWGVNKFTASRVMRRLIDEGRLRKVGPSDQNNGLFVVVDPEELS